MKAWGRAFSPRLAGVILLTLAGCDVRIRPIWEPRDSGSAVPDASHPTVRTAHTVGGWAGPQNASGDGGSASGGSLATTTGGGASAPVTVDASDTDAINQFKTYADRKTGAAVIHVKGMISFAGFGDSQVRVASNTTILGMDDHSGFTGGGLDLVGKSNIIIKNLVIAKAAGTDAITIQGPISSNIWVDHCDLSSEQHPDGTSYDGLIDITHAAEAITISWTVFHDHRDASIVGHSDLNASEDTGHLHVTYDHDLFRRVDAGPRIRFGTVHLYNVFFDHVTLYGVASTMGAEVLVENSYFQAVTAAGQDADYGADHDRAAGFPVARVRDLGVQYRRRASAPTHITTQAHRLDADLHVHPGLRPPRCAPWSTGAPGPAPFPERSKPAPYCAALRRIFRSERCRKHGRRNLGVRGPHGACRESRAGVPGSRQRRQLAGRHFPAHRPR